MRYSDIKKMYLHHYNILKEGYVYVEITDEENRVISAYATKLSELRWGEPKCEGTTKEELRNAYFLGASGETVCAKKLGHEQNELEFDIGKKGNAKDYAHGDLSCLGYTGVGVKVSKFGLPPMVIKADEWTDGRCGHEIICTVFEQDVERDEKGNIKRVKGVWINGFAKDTILKEYQSRDLIIKPDNPKYADRAGFYGFDELITLRNDDEIKLFKAFYRKIKNS